MERNLFQDGEAFLTNRGEKGPSGAGANGQSGEHNALMSLALLQYLTGRSVIAPPSPGGAHEPSE